MPSTKAERPAPTTGQGPQIDSLGWRDRGTPYDTNTLRDFATIQLAPSGLIIHDLGVAGAGRHPRDTASIARRPDVVEAEEADN
jgi:hypothetical protein